MYAICKPALTAGGWLAVGQPGIGLKLAVGALQISGQLAPLATSREARVLQWQALSRELRECGSTVKPAEPAAAKPPRVLPADGAGCIELFVIAPGGWCRKWAAQLQEEGPIACGSRILGCWVGGYYRHQKAPAC